MRRDAGHPTGHYFVTHGEQGHAFTYHRAGSAASRLTAQDLPLGVIARARILHVSAISQAIGRGPRGAVQAAVAAARTGGVWVSYDTNLRLRLWDLDEARDTVHAAVAEADIALPGLDDAVSLTGLDDPDAIVDFYLGLGPRIVVLSLGGDRASKGIKEALAMGCDRAIHVNTDALLSAKIVSSGPDLSVGATISTAGMVLCSHQTRVTS